jgi:ferredoxin
MSYFELTTALDRADGVISVGKLKTHTFTVLTGAVKNLFGLIPGLKKAELHFRLKGADSFSGMLVDLSECVKPRLTVIDAVVGMDGEGPAGGRPKRIGLLIASDDTHALDAHFAHIAGADGDTVPSVRIARSRGLGPSDHAHIRVVGDGADVDRIDGFRLPSTTQRYGGIPHYLRVFVGEGVTRKPVFLASRCTRCGQCIEVCPAEALVQGDRKPTIDRAICIRCYCCQEACPSRAIVLRRRPLRSLASAAASGLMKRLRR